MENKIKLAIVDDELLITELLVNYFASNEHIEVIYHSGDGNDFLDRLRVKRSQPNIALLDLKMKAINGSEITEVLKLKYPRVKIIIMSSYYDKSYTGHMLKLGVNAFIPKGLSLEKLTEIIQEVDENDFFFLNEQIEALRSQIAIKAPKPAIDPIEKLTKRELEVLNLICRQYTTKEIAKKLYITARTVDGHRTSLLIKSDVKNTAGLIIWAIQNQIIDINELPLYR